MTNSSDTRKTAVVLAGIAAIEGAWVILNMRTNPLGFLRYTGFVDGRAGPLGWILALAIFAAFTGFSSRLPSVRANLFAFTWLKALGLAVAIAAGFCEEAIFRKLLMDALAHRGLGVAVQVTASALAFGLVHGIWGALRRNLSGAIGAVVATGALGFGLAVTYIAGHRSLEPCVVSHFLINAFVEPGLVLAAVRGEMRKPSKG